MRAWQAAAWSGGLSACAVTTPPPSHFGSIAPTTGREIAAVDVAAAIHPLGVEASGTGALPLTRNFAVDLRTQLAQGSIVASPGVWVRAPVGQQRLTHVGVRAGGVVGTGDVAQLLAFDYPFAGPSLHLQLARQYGQFEQPGIVSVSLGAEYTIGPQLDLTTRVDGETVDLIVLPGLWFDLDVRGELPVGERTAFVLGGGVNTWSGLLWLPFFEVGLRL